MALDLNPILSELDGLSPQAKGALAQAHQNITGAAPAIAPVAQAPAPSVRPMPVPGAAGVPSIGGMSAPAPAPSPMAAAHTAELGRLTTGDTGKSGIAQIKSPWARVPLQIADAIGGGLFPGIEQRLPGTEGHHQVLVREAQRDVAGDEAASANEAKNNELAAQTREDDARAQNLANPPSEFTPIPTDTGYVNVNHRTGAASPVTVNGNQVQPIEKTVQPHFTAMPDGSVVGIHTDPKTGKMSAEVVYKGDPKVQTSIANLEIGGKPHSVIINSQTGETIKDLGESGIKPPTVNVNAGTAALDRESARFASDWKKISSGATDQLEKINEAQYMIGSKNAESQALGIPKVLTALVSGQGTGVRITQAELNQIAHARGIQGDFEGTLQKLNGKGQLSHQQQTELGGILEDVKGLIARRLQIANDTLDNINTAKSRDDIARFDKEARQRLADMQSGKGQGAGQKWEATATGKDGHKIGLRDGKWFDIQSGKAIQ